MSYGACVLIALLSVSINASAEDQSSLRPVSAIVSASPLVGGLGLTGAGITAASAVTILPAPIDAELRLTAKQAAELDAKLTNSKDFNERWIRGYSEYYRGSGSQLNHDRWFSLQKADPQRFELYDELMKTKDLSHLKKTPGLEAALEKYKALSEELFDEQKLVEAYKGKQLRNPDPSWIYSPKGRSSKVIRAELEAHIQKMRAKFIEPSLKAAKLAEAEAKSVSVLGLARLKRLKAAAGVAGIGVGVLGFGMVAGQVDSDPVMTAIDAGSDSGMVKDLQEAFVKNNVPSISVPRIVPAAHSAN